ncbi:MAG: DUF6094 domain-containing protein [Chloroflexota bacterium]
MTRLANMEKAGYFPLPPTVTDCIQTFVTAPHGGRVLDPCTGEGTALVHLADMIGLEPYGVELHEERAQRAREQVADLLNKRPVEAQSAQPLALTRVLHDSYLNLKTAADGYNLLYLNPPYDYDHEDGRLEYQFLWRTRPYLQPDGLLVYVIPRHILKLRKLAQYLAAHFQDIRVYRFPDESYARFKQVVVFGSRRAKAVPPDSELVNELRAYGEGEVQLLAMPSLSSLTAVSEPLYSLPSLVVKDSQFKFRSQFVDPVDALAEARQLGASTKPAWREHLDPDSSHVPLRPLTPLKIGHMNSIIAAGHLNNQVLVEGDERLLIKGRSYKVTRAEEFEEPLPDGRIRVTHLETESVVTDITTIDTAGGVMGYQGGELEQFLQKWLVGNKFTIWGNMINRSKTQRLFFTSRSRRYA